MLQLRHPWADGTTHVAFTPTAFLERLAVLVPRPHVNLVLYHGLLAPLFVAQSRDRLVVYVDGFNLYYGAVKGTPYKWLDLQRYFTLLRPHDDIQQIRSSLPW